MRKPWFTIIAVTEGGRRSLADIAKAVSEECGIPLYHMRGPRQYWSYKAARKRFYMQAFHERPDLSSEQITRFLGRTGSTLRHEVRKVRLRELAA